MPNPPRHIKGGYVDPEQLPKGPNGRALCRQCQTEVTPPRRTFCSKTCVDTWMIRTGSRTALHVRRRDRGICALCGLDCEALRRELKQLQAMYPIEGRRQAIDEFRAKHGIPRHRNGRLWDIDHIVPVVEGGGACDLSNLQTVCLRCHAKLTADLAAKRAAARRASKP